MDLRMPDCDGAEATGRIRSSRPGTEGVVLTTYEDDESILAALQAGARGYLTKDPTRWQIAQAIHAAAGGQAILSPAIQDKLLAAATKPAQTPDSPPEPVPKIPLPDGLSPREADVLRLIADGQSNREIAATLFVGEATV